MKKAILFIVASLLFTSNAMARDDVLDFSIEEALSVEKIKNGLGESVKFYFGNQKHAATEKNYGEFRTNKKTNAFNKSDKGACQWAFLSAMISLRDRAINEGGNAVINVKSNYKNNLTSSEETFQCGAGAFVAGVALVGDVVKLK